MAIYLGLDSSTQSLTAVAIEIPARKILGAWSVNFAARLPAYGTENGVLRGADPRVAHSPPLMWVDEHPGWKITKWRCAAGAAKDI